MTSHFVNPSSKGEMVSGVEAYPRELRPNRPNRPKADENEEAQVEVVPQAYQQFHATRHQTITNFYICEEFQEPKMYTDMIHRIRTAQPQDIIYIHLNTPGGRLDTGIGIINAITDSQARIIGVLDSKAYSLGTLVLLSCDEFIIHDNCLFMIHNFSSGTFGKGNEQQAELQATIRWFTKLATKYYVPFLSRDELDRVLRGEDFWMDSDEVKKRLKAMVKIREEEMNAPPKTSKKPKKLKVVEAEVAEEPKEEIVVTPALPRRANRKRGANALEGGVLPTREATTIPPTIPAESPVK